jgi:hypothetical protein
MKQLQKSVLALVVLAFCAAPLWAQGRGPTTTQTPSRVSPHETISNRIGAGRGGVLVTITYGRPYSRDNRSGQIRKVWGTLVPWDKAWRMGSDEATTLITSQNMVIGETTIPPGAYTLYMVPSENGTSKLAFSKKIGFWGIPVDETQDLARVDLKKETFEGAPVGQFTMAIDNTPPGGVIRLLWENTQYSVPFTLKP